MRWTMLFLIVLSGGCQRLSSLDRWNSPPPPSVMPFWESYQRCLNTTDLMALHQMVEQFEQAIMGGSEPPRWMTSWSDHVARQPLRTAVDPRALGAACALRTASVMANLARFDDATALYQRVIARYPDRELVYYVEQAKDALAALPRPNPALFAHR